ncbi:hypothetical protein C2E23DRAFT_785522 [Lenzites betulinus]|nr:hypothetical protein C2E23DRAFT_785522 [Lenzites betulinus]
MSNHAQSSPFSRLSRLALPFKSNHAAPRSAEPPSEEWYIPYHGPIEPSTVKDERNTDSWGHLVSGWLMENEDERSERSPRIRALSNASRQGGEEGKRKSRVQTFVKLEQAGGVGDTPQPVAVRARGAQEAPLHHRSSLASILSFGTRKAAHRLQHSSSAGSLRRDPVPPVPPGPAHDAAPPPTLYRRHPYALATPAPSAPSSPYVSSPVATTAPRKNPPASRFSVRLLDPLARKPSAPAYLLPTPRPSRISLKASMSTPNLRQATGTAAVLPKGKQRWLSAETWCDALILPRPRFAMRVGDGDGEGGSGRIVSPPESPLWPPGMEPPLDAAGAKALKKSQSAVQLSAKTHQASPPRPPPVREEPRQEIPVAGPSRLVPEKTEAANTNLRPPRPKSFALDDLALPSPAPSLSKVLEDGRQLAEERKAWQREAAKSFGHNRARSVSRARTKSLGARTPGAGHAREPSAFDVLAEATLLGSQRRRPTVHVRVRPPRSDGHGTASAFGTTVTGTATGIATWTSASHGQTRSRGHGHSNSVGSVGRSRSDESFMWTPGHGRNHSLGRSALRIVRTTATTAAGFCGIAGVQDGDDATGRPRPPMNDKAAAMEDALRRDGTKVIHLRDQMPHQDDHVVSGLVVITPPLTGPRTQLQPNAGPSGAKGVSPTPSAQSTSVEGMGIAISSPVPPEDAFEKEPIRIPHHPYAQGAAYPYYQRPAGRAPILPALQAVRQDSTGAPSPTSTTGEDGVTKHRQPVAVHPYSPYAQIQHPFAAATGTDPTPKRTRASRHLEVRPPTASMFAELAPGQIREILPDEIQYSPFIPTPPVQLPAGASSNPSGHPYGPSTKRTSEWGFADALDHTMQRPLSTDSGLGTSESHAAPAEAGAIEVSHVLGDDDDEVVISPRQAYGAQDPTMLSPHSHSLPGARRPAMVREATHASSNHTVASSPMEHVNPPAFRKEPSVGARSFNSSGSSPGPGVVSQQSSPPLSPRPITGADADLERFRDLFYLPPESESRTPSSDDSRAPVSRRPSSSIHVELGARSTRTLSGLTSLARQLNENMEEMEAYEAMMDGYDRERASPMWGARLGGQRAGADSEPPQGLSQSPPGLVYEREGTGTPLRLPIDASLALSQPEDDVPEDVESSRASSMLEMPLDDDEEQEHMRIGEIEAVSTPPIVSSDKRFSTHLSAVGFPVGAGAGSGEASPMSEYHAHGRVVSQGSLGVLHSSDVARSSFMTNTSGMSGLSDFPSPPDGVTPSHMSILNSYFGDGARERDYRGGRFESVRPALQREASQGTFGPAQMGEAL